MSQVVRHTKSIKRIHKKLKVIANFLRENIGLIQQGLTMSQDPPPAYSEKGQDPGYPDVNPQSFPSQPGYPQSYQSQVQQNVVVVQQPSAYPVGVLRFGRYPLQMRCPQCQADIVTSTDLELGTFAWCMCVLIACFWLWPFCFIALCIDSLKDVIHSCPNCKKELGRYKRM